MAEQGALRFEFNLEDGIFEAIVVCLREWRDSTTSHENFAWDEKFKPCIRPYLPPGTSFESEDGRKLIDDVVQTIKCVFRVCAPVICGRAVLILITRCRKKALPGSRESFQGSLTILTSPIKILELCHSQKKLISMPTDSWGASSSSSYRRRPMRASFSHPFQTLIIPLYTALAEGHRALAAFPPRS